MTSSRKGTPSSAGQPSQLLPQWVEIVPDQGRPRFLSRWTRSRNGVPTSIEDSSENREDALDTSAFHAPIPRDLPAALTDLLSGGGTVLAMLGECGLRSAAELTSKDPSIKSARPFAGLVSVMEGSTIPLEELALIARRTGINRWLIALHDRCLYLERRTRAKIGLLPGLAIRMLGKELKRPFKNPRGLRFQTSLPEPDAKAWLIFEDGIPLLKECSNQRPLEELGGGLFNISGKNLNFTSSDGSDPNTNRKSYTLVRQDSPLGRWLATKKGFAASKLSERDARTWVRVCGGQYALRREFCPHSMIAAASSSADLEDRIKALIRKDNLALAESPPRTTPTSFLFLAAHLQTGGAERQIVNLATGLKSMGHDVRFLTLRPVEDSKNPLVQDLQQAGIDVRDIDHPADELDLSQLFVALGEEKLRLLGDLPEKPGNRIWQTTKHLLNDPVDVICSFLDEPNIVGTFASILAGQRQHAVLSFRNVNPSKLTYYEPWFLEFYQLLRLSDRALYTGNSLIGNEDYRKWIELPPEKTIHHLPNGVDFDGLRLRAANERKSDTFRSLLGNGPVILGVFRLVEQKRPLLFLEVCREILEARPDVSVAIAGEGPEEDAMRRWTREHDLEKSIHLLGLRSDVPSLMEQSDLLLSTSENEGTPNVVLEAHGMKLPVVASNAGDMRRCVRDGESGFVHEQDDRDGLVGSCIRLLENEGLRSAMGKAGRSWVTSEYGLSRYHHRFLSLFNQRDEETDGITPSS